MDVKIITNVGIFEGLAGKGLIYAGKTPGGSYFFALQMVEANVTKWRYYRKSLVETGLSSNDIKLVDNLNMALFIDTAAPEFVTGGGSFPEITTVVNGAQLPRLYNLEPAYSLKGEGILTADVDALKTGTTNSGSGLKTIKSQVTNADGSVTITYDDGTTSVTPGSTKALGFIPTDFKMLTENPLQFLQDNILFVAVLVAVVYFLRRKKKKPLWLF